MNAAGILINLLLLTLLFTLGSSGALLLRRRLLRGRENVMRIVWAAVLITAVLPLYSSRAAISFGTDPVSADASARTQVLYVPDGAEEDGFVSDAQRDIDLARKLYGDSFTSVVISDGSTADTDIRDRGANGSAEAVFCVLLCVWAGVSAVLAAKSLFAYHSAKKLMRDNSRPYTEGRAAALFNECRERLGMRQYVALRVVSEGFSCSPCVAGLFRPGIYIGGECLGYSDDRLRFIFMHELCHAARRDLLFKLFALIVTSLHWFNPLSRLVYRAVAEDCELACDTAALRILGRQHSDSYMVTILDTAERLCDQRQPALANRLGGGLFMSGTPGRRFLERRYRNMKTTKTCRFSIVAAAVFILAALAVNTVVMSSCGIPLIENPASGSAAGSSGNIFLDEAIRGYYGLTDSSAVTPEMIAGIETLVIRASDINSIAGKNNPGSDPDNAGEFTIVDYIVNGKEITAFPKRVEPRRFEENYLGEISGYFENTDIGDAGEILKIVNAFYCLKNYYTAADGAGRAEILAMFPDAADYPEGCYIYDPYASPRETEHISNFYETADLYSGFTLLSGYFDASALVSLPNLVSITYMGVTPVNEKLPDGCVSEYVEYRYGDISSGSAPAQPAPSGTPKVGDSRGEKGTVMFNGEPVTVDLSYGMFELEPKGMMTDENGAEYLAFNSKALNAAILEYFVMEYNQNNRITPEHLAQITSIEAVIRTDLDYLFDDSLELHGGHYIQFTINGETQGIIPTYYNAKEFPCGKASDMLYDAGYYELAEEGGESYYKLVGSDGSAIAETFRQLAVINGYKALVTDCFDEDGDGSAAFVTEFTGSWDCVAARYVNGIPIAQNELEADRQYFPNLQAFSFKKS